MPGYLARFIKYLICLFSVSFCLAMTSAIVNDFAEVVWTDISVAAGVKPGSIATHEKTRSVFIWLAGCPIGKSYGWSRRFPNPGSIAVQIATQPRGLKKINAFIRASIGHISILQYKTAQKVLGKLLQDLVFEHESSIADICRKNNSWLLYSNSQEKTS